MEEVLINTDIYLMFQKLYSKMKIPLSLAILKEIVEDGIKEIKSRLNFTTRQRAMKQEVLDKIHSYRDLLLGDYVPTLISDFGESIEVQFNGGRMDVEEVKKLKHFIALVNKSVDKKYLLDVLDEIKGALKSKDQIVSVSSLVKEGHDWIMNRIEEYIKRETLDTVHRQTVEKCKLESAVFNFTDKEIPDDVKEMFKNGVDAVPRLKMTRQEIKDRTNDSLLAYLERFRRRKKQSSINASSVLDWLGIALEQKTDLESDEFYMKFKERYSGMMSELDLVYHEQDFDSEEEIRKKLEIDGCVIVPCDKKMGMSMFTLETMREIDSRLMKQLGATEIQLSKEEILDDVFSNIDEFEKSLDSSQKEYIDIAYRDRDLKAIKSVITFPFLKSTHKVHKMTAEEISRKDITKLKFRPVVDARRWITRGYSTLAMNMMRKAVQDLLSKAGPVLANMKVKNGWRFAVGLMDLKLGEGFDISFSVDIQEAYTNVTADMINEAISNVCGYLEYSGWKIKLMTKLIDLVLSNNYAETSGGLYLFKMILPMGYRLSGDALDIVALSGEMERMFNLGRQTEMIPGMPIGELLEYPEEVINVDADKESKMASGIKAYKRYVDDTYVRVHGKDIEEVVAAILAVGFMMPRGLTVNLVLNIWRAEFLDVVCWKNVSSRSISTMVRKRFSVPFGHVNHNSEHPKIYKMGSLLGEMLRNRRLSSDQDIVKKCDESTALEFQSIGYSRRQVLEAMEEAKENIEKNYSGMYVKIEEENEDNFVYFGGSLEYNGLYKYHEVVKNFIQDCKPVSSPGLLMVPAKKMKSLAYTKNQYLKRQRDDLEKRGNKTKKN